MATTTNDVIISYDIEKIGTVHSFVKECMEKKGYFDAFIQSGTTNLVELPNTTLWRQNTSSKQGFDDVKDSLAQYEKEQNLKPKFEKCIATHFTGTWWGRVREATAEELKKYPIK